MLTAALLPWLLLAAVLATVATLYALEWRRAVRRQDVLTDALIEDRKAEIQLLRERVRSLQHTADELTSMALQTTHPALREAQLSVKRGIDQRTFHQAIEEQLAALDDDEYREELRAEIAQAYDRNPALDVDQVLDQYFPETRPARRD